MGGSRETFFTGSVAAQNITNFSHRLGCCGSMIIMALLWHYYGHKPDQNCINLKAGALSFG